MLDSLRGVRKPVWNLVLVLMTGLTCWAVSTVSIWLVPAYLGIMVLLLGSPQPNGENRASPSPSEPSRPRRSTRPAKSATRGGSSAAEAKRGDPESPSDSDCRVDAPEGSATATGAAKSGSRTAKSKGTRGRSRKSAAKGGSNPAAPAPPATWIRIGPGKFVRADVHPGAEGEIEAEASASPFPNTIAGVDVASTPVETGPVDFGAGSTSVESIEPETTPAPELELGCHDIASSALDSLSPEEPVPPTILEEAVPVSPPVLREEYGDGVHPAAVDDVLPDSEDMPHGSGTLDFESTSPDMSEDAEPDERDREVPNVEAAQEAVEDDPNAEVALEEETGLTGESLDTDPGEERLPIQSMDAPLDPSSPEAESGLEGNAEPGIKAENAWEETDEPEAPIEDVETNEEESPEAWDEVEESDPPTAETPASAEAELESWEDVGASDEPDSEADDHAELDNDDDRESREDVEPLTSGIEAREAVSPRHRLRGAIRGRASARVTGRSRNRHPGPPSVDRSQNPGNRARYVFRRAGAWRSRIDRGHRPRSPPHRSFPNPKSNRVD